MEITAASVSLSVLEGLVYLILIHHLEFCDLKFLIYLSTVVID